MGTRSLTVLKDGDQEIVVMYRQYDGYLTGHGLELAEFLAPMHICNGIGVGDDDGVAANGMECLAAQIIARFKSQSQVGGIYLFAAGSRAHDEEFVYFVDAGFSEERGRDVPFIIAQNSDGKTLYEGPAHAMAASIRLAQKPEQRYHIYRRQVARTLFVSAYADWKEEYDGGFPAGTKIDKVAPTTPPYVAERALKLIAELEQENDCTLDDLYERALEADGIYGGHTVNLVEEWAHYLTMECLGHGVAWSDDHAEYEHQTVNVEFSPFDLDNENFPIPEDHAD